MTTELHFAAQRGDITEVVRLIKSGAEIDSRDERGNTPLKYVSAEPHIGVLGFLLDNGASPLCADDRGFTPLHCVAGHGFYDEALDMASLLVEAGADVNARSVQYGYVPLHEARTASMIDFLVSRGADMSIRNCDGQTPYEYQLEDGNLVEAECLRQNEEKHAVP